MTIKERYVKQSWRLPLILWESESLQRQCDKEPLLLSGNNSPSSSSFLPKQSRWRLLPYITFFQNKHPKSENQPHPVNFQNHNPPDFHGNLFSTQTFPQNPLNQARSCSPVAFSLPSEEHFKNKIMKRKKKGKPVTNTRDGPVLLIYSAFATYYFSSLKKKNTTAPLWRRSQRSAAPEPAGERPGTSGAGSERAAPGAHRPPQPQPSRPRRWGDGGRIPPRGEGGRAPAPGPTLSTATAPLGPCTSKAAPSSPAAAPASGWW